MPISHSTLPIKLDTGKPFKGYYYYTLPQLGNDISFECEARVLRRWRVTVTLKNFNSEMFGQANDGAGDTNTEK